MSAEDEVTTLSVASGGRVQPGAIEIVETADGQKTYRRDRIAELSAKADTLLSKADRVLAAEEDAKLRARINRATEKVAAEVARAGRADDDPPD